MGLNGGIADSGSENQCISRLVPLEETDLASSHAVRPCSWESSLGNLGVDSHAPGQQLQKLFGIIPASNLSNQPDECF